MVSVKVFILALGCLLTLVPLVFGQRSYSTQRYRQSSSSSSSLTPIASLPLARFVPRYECRNVVLPTRSSIVPHGVVFTGHVDEIKPDMDYNDDSRYSVTVTVRRVYYGSKKLRKQQVTVSGLGGGLGSGPEAQWCHSNAKQGDTWLFITQPISYPNFFRLNYSLIKINLKNLERMEGILNDEPFRKLTTVEELPCETKYCENNANCINTKKASQFETDGARCECLTFCRQSYAPVCGSNNETYTNECDMRLKSCYSGKNLFVKSLNSCSTRPTVPVPSSYPDTPRTSWSTQTYRSQVTGPAVPSRPNTTSTSYDSYPYRRQYTGSSPSSHQTIPGQTQQSRNRVTTTTTTHYRPNPFITSTGYQHGSSSSSSSSQGRPSLTLTYPNTRSHQNTGHQETWGYSRAHHAY